MPHLPDGLYERLITERLKTSLAELAAAGRRVDQRRLDPADGHVALARHVHDVVLQVLRAVPVDARPDSQVELVNRVVQVLVEALPQAVDAGAAVSPPPEELLAVAPPDLAAAAGGTRHEIRPLVGLSASDLLVNARGEPGVGHALEREIPSADSIDLLCAFVRWTGLRVLEPRLRRHCEQGRRVRVITTTYTGSTERRALDWLTSLGAEVKVSYDTRSTRLHAKAWLFHRATGYATAYIGSSNLSRAALLDGVEWNVRLTEVSSPDILKKFQATFESYWEDREYESYEPGQAERFDTAVSSTAPVASLPFLGLDVHPYLHQQEILDRLQAERERHGRYRNLVVAATGTGKTIVSALDYRRLRRERGGSPTLLFVAHRKELLTQSLQAFRVVLRDGAFGELYVDGHRPNEWRHVFASVQSLAQVDLAALPATAFDVVVVDEFHHAAAATYRRLLDHLTPRVLLGLTATPERTDGRSVLDWFDGRIAVELRLWEALERGLLCPFHYFGLHDTVDLSGVSWRRGGYDIAALQGVYTGDHARVNMVVQAIRDKVTDPGRMRALGFCVSITHAEFMARACAARGLASAAVSANTGPDERDQALRQLRNGELNILFTVDVFNEGIDVPAIDTVLFLRPTESATVFLQQLGRGLRRADDKDCLTVLDFIGPPHRRFRFDRRFRALLGDSRPGLIRQLDEGFPHLPAGCRIQLDRVATDIVLQNVRSAVGGRFQGLVDELRGMPPETTLGQFVEHAGIEVADLYRNPGWSWSRAKREAGLPVPAVGPDEAELARAVRRFVHMDDEERLGLLVHLLRSGRSPRVAAATERERRILSAVHATCWGAKHQFASLQASLDRIWQHRAVCAELVELVERLEDEATHVGHPLDTELGWSHSVPLRVHCRYRLDDVLTAVGEQTVERPYRIREGTLFNKASRSDLFFVTLEKTEAHYSPSTMYNDYAISPTLFHWESQSTTTERSPTAQRYLHHREQRSHILLFVRRTAKIGNWTLPYNFLGPVDYVSHTGERPLAITWRLRRPMPADFFREAKLAAGC